MVKEFRKKTKIVATLGPATSSRETLLAMMTKGVDVFRVNFSHANYEDISEKIKTIHELNAEHGFSTAVLADLQGPKLRIGKMINEDVVINAGDILTFTHEKIEGTQEKVYMTYEKFAHDVKVGENILIDDGKLIFKVIFTDGISTVKAETIQGGPLRSKKGVNLPNTNVSLPALTEKDIEDAIFAIKQEVDWFALSFVRNSQDLIDLQTLIKEHSNHKIPIIAKIEKPEALINISDILTECDGLMVARGDLGVEVAFEEVPAVQKDLIDKAKLARKPVIVATQMMETMISSLTPTRAEVNDVANAVFDGADAVMLSAETSVGLYPVQVIEKMTKILQTVEDDEHIRIPPHQPKVINERFVTDVICYQAAQMVSITNAVAISTLTYTGYTAFQISSHRPLAYILIYTPNIRIIRMLNLLWGVKAHYYEGSKSTDETVVEVNEIAKEDGYVYPGDFVINLNAMPVFDQGITNTVRLSRIKW